MVSPQVVMAMKLTASCLSSSCVVFRTVFVHRHQPRTFKAKLVHIFLFITCVLDFAADGTSAWALNQEITDPQSFESWHLRTEVSKALFASHIHYYFALTVVKAAYLAYFSELFVGSYTRKRYLIHLAIAIWFIANLTGILLLFLWCSPIYKNWRDFDASDRRCPSIYDHTVFITMATLTIVSDLAVLAVPLTLISTIHFSRRNRRLQITGLLFVFAIGMLSVAATVVRMCLIFTGLQADGGLPWSLVRNTMIWAHVEVFAAVLAITLPSFGLALSRVRGRRRGMDCSSDQMMSAPRSTGGGCPDWADAAERRKASVATVVDPWRTADSSELDLVITAAAAADKREMIMLQTRMEQGRSPQVVRFHGSVSPLAGNSTTI
ncbi:hypothetical protein BZA05DRAFT_270287 [Tricharina praecox]|uniref:uncharacterized protein n=1 Tax=Tricharina praecox TaxID=43433 RepID=UPI00221F9F97|nr:uncharacterized protein BZA05DRAFT_270287 [Tricharina praecox]KAI5853799.1 hypothetical protein BZA05DRAFT_270287 [Tricharina praecox]